MKIEGTLEAARNKMKLGATIDGAFVELSSVGLRNKMRVEPVEGARQGSLPLIAFPIRVDSEEGMHQGMLQWRAHHLIASDGL